MSVPLARRNLFHEKGKFVISIMGTAAAIALILIIIGFRAGLYASVTSYIDNLDADLILAQSGVRGMYSSNSAVDASIHDDAQSAVNATEASHIIVADVIFSIASAKTPVVLIGYDTTSNFGGPWEIGEGRLIDAPSEILLDSWLAKKSGIQ